MSKQLIIILSGKKQAGKNTACNFIVATYFNKIDNCSDNYVDSNGHLCNKLPAPTGIIQQVTNQFENQGIKVYSFADPLKRFCIDVLGAPEESCYGTDEQKRAIIPHLLWENLPRFIRWVHAGARSDRSPFLYQADTVTEDQYYQLLASGCLDKQPIRQGPMTGREIMQVMGTDVCRRLYGDCWARGTMNTVKRDGYPVALVCDGRFPNEINISKEFGAKTIRLLRKISDDNHRSETALDDFPLENYDFVVHNQELSIAQTCDALKPKIDEWIRAYA